LAFEQLNSKYSTNQLVFANKKSKPIIVVWTFVFGAKDAIRTRDPNLGKVVLYQLSYFRIVVVLKELNVFPCLGLQR
jgi:hypothetical protein